MEVIQPLQDCWREQAREFLVRNWGSARIVSRGRVHAAHELAGFVLFNRGQIAGLATYEIRADQCEIVSLDSCQENRGIGTALVEQLIKIARASQCRRVWLVTTNDNVRAMGFYQRRGFNMAALHVDAVSEARSLKPEIPARGLDGIPIRHEIEFELVL